VLKICQECGKEYTTQGKKYCSNECRGNATKGKNNYSWRGGPVARECQICGKQFEVRASRIRNGEGKYCSRECSSKAQVTRVECRCVVCGVMFERTPCLVTRGGGNYCSKQCHGIAQRKLRLGENCPNWKGGSTPKGKLIRGSASYKDWREAVFARDNWTCQDCGERNYKGRGKTVFLHAHHIFSFADFPEHQLAVWNGVTLCEICHSKHHSQLAAQIIKKGAVVSQVS